MATKNNERDSFEVTITGGSRDFDVREKLKITDPSTAYKIDKCPDDMQIPVESYAFIHIHNPNADKDNDKDYDQICLLCDDGNCFVTGSESFISQFERIWKILTEADEKVIIRPVKIPSKKREGKYFIYCAGV